MGKEEKEKKEERDKSEKKKKRTKSISRTTRTLLCILQHIFLGITVVSVLIVATGSTVYIEGFGKTLSFHMFHQDRNSAYEDSDMFNSLFGYMTADIIRYGVVSSQLETDGSFDGSKVIDVTAFNYRDVGLPERYVTADYHLEDLLKWANYGFEWSMSDMTPTQADNFLADKTRVTIVDPQSQYYNTSDANYLKSDIESYTFVNDVSANQLWVDMDDYDGFVEGYGSNGTSIVSSRTGEITVEYADKQDYILSEVTEEYIPQVDSEDGINSYSILVNRYKTAEGKNLEEYVSDWDLYYDLCHNVQNAARSLSYNYNEYLNYKEYYNAQNSNVRYMIMKTVGENTQFYSNLTDQQELENVTEFMVTNGEADGAYVSGKYIYYSPADMVYLTNTTIAEETIRKILQGYDYAYPETIRIWINVDTTYPVTDAFRQGSEGFYSYMPYFWQLLVLAVASCILYFMLLFYLTAAAGQDVDEEGNSYIRLQSFDRVPTETAVIIAVCVGVLAAFILFALSALTGIDPTSIETSPDAVMYEEWFIALLFGLTFVADTAAMFFFYSLVRRIKTRTLWSNSYLCKLVHKLKLFAWKVYDNSHIVLRTWVPYGAFLLVNFILLMYVTWSDGLDGVIVLVLAVALDIVAGNLLYRNAKEQQNIVEGIEKIAGGQLEYQVKTDELHGYNLTLANSVNSIGQGIKDAVEISMKDERMKADLITNVSHDIKTPLTSIINYVDLIKREQFDNEKINNYINVLDEKSQRLKQLTDDLVEASKISSGNISLNFEKINLTELMNQTIGEFSEKFEQKNLTTVMNINVQNAVIEADSRRIWRVIENLFNNIFKYAMEGTRVYLAIDSLPDNTAYIALSIKNISASPLNCNPDELTERFIRGDESRTTEGSGLGLSIAKNLTEAQKGTFEIQLDGDLFKVILTFPLAEV